LDLSYEIGHVGELAIGWKRPEAGTALRCLSHNHEEIGNDATSSCGRGYSLISFRLSRLSESPNRWDLEYTAETERWSSEAIASTVWPDTAIDFSRSSSAVVQFLETRMRKFIALNPLRAKWGRGYHRFHARAIAMMV
jgi:hypothetical protein